MILPRVSKLLVIVAVVVSSIAIGGGLIAGGAAGQIPSIPATYEPVEITLSGDAEINTRVRVEAVVDGTVNDSLVTEADGTNPSGEVLEVQEPKNTDSVDFRIGDTVVKTVTWKPGSQELVLDGVDPEVVASVLNVTITERTASPVEVGEPVSVTAQLENPDRVGVEARQTITLSTGAETVATEDVTVPVGETQEVELTWTPSSGETGDTALTVNSENDADTAIVRVEAAQSDEDEEQGEDGDGSGGSGGGAGGAGGDGGSAQQSDETASQSPTVTDIRDTLTLLTPTESQTPAVDTDTETDGVTVVPPEFSSVQRIVFNKTSVNGSVTISEYNDPPKTLRTRLQASIQGDVGSTGNVSVISVSDITPTTEAAKESEATVQFSIDRDQVENPAQLRVFKETYDFEQQETLWRQLETTVEETTDETITIEATADSFSLFAIGEVSSVEETGESTTDDETRDGSENVSDTGDGESSDTDDGIPGFGIGAAVAGILSAAGVIARSRQNDN